MKRSTLIEIRTKPEFCPSSEKRLSLEIRNSLGIEIDRVAMSKCYRLETDLSCTDLLGIAEEVLADAVTEESFLDGPFPEGFTWALEIAPKEGVTDNSGHTARIAIEDYRRKPLGHGEKVSSVRRYYFSGPLSAHEVRTIGVDLLGNSLIETFTLIPLEEQPTAKVEAIELPDDDEQLTLISRQRQLALSVDEMRAIRHHFLVEEVREERQRRGLPLHPTDCELEALAQTWSEHCKHKIFNAKITYRDGNEGAEVIDSLFHTYIRGATARLSEEIDWLVSVFKDNAGIIRFTDQFNAVFKVETHNSPSALDPYGGALTGILGVNRDVMGTGIGARLLANTNVFCLADPSYSASLPPRILHPRRILAGVRKGVEDGGNKSGVPTVNGSLVFDNRYMGKPLIYCGSVGIMPKAIKQVFTHEKTIHADDLIVIVGGRTGKDGIHGATFSSEELHEASPCSAVQIGDPFTQKKVHDFLLEARDRLLYRTLTDNGAGGFSSSIGELAELSGGCEVHLDRAPLKYPGLTPWEILLSESQERMTLAVPPDHLPTLKRLASVHDVEIAAIGTFTDSGFFHVLYRGEDVAWLSLEFLHGGVPQLQLEAEWPPGGLRVKQRAPEQPSPEHALLTLLQRLNVCSKEAIVRQYDHEVQASTLVKPLCGSSGNAPSDGAVVQPVETMTSSTAGLVITHGLCPRLSDWDAHTMTLHAIDEAVRSAVALGADPDVIALLDNFCWPDPVYHPERNPDGKVKLAQLVRSAKALYQGALDYRTPFISGKDSMKNDYRIGEVKISVPPTLLISALGVIPDIQRAVTSDFKVPGHLIYLLGATTDEMAGSEYEGAYGGVEGFPPSVNAITARDRYLRLHEAMRKGWIASCHDCSDGGLAVAIAECAFGGTAGADIEMANLPVQGHPTDIHLLFAETPSRLIVTVDPKDRLAFEECMGDTDWACMGRTTDSPYLCIKDCEGQSLLKMEIAQLKQAWEKPFKRI